MNQFIPYFLGQAEPPYRARVTAQKVMRTNDIENVGQRRAAPHVLRDARQLLVRATTSRPMPIRWAHELITEGYGIEHDRLWVTVFDDDEEVGRGVGRCRGARPGPDRPARGCSTPRASPPTTGTPTPPGPPAPAARSSSTADPKYGPDGGPDVDEERFMEIWNLVFIQDQVDADLTIVAPLPGKNVDTGSSLERVATVLQGVDNVFETDLFRPTLEVAERLSGRKHGQDPHDDVSLKIIAEHGRATTFLIADGVQPSNDGRGYVLRRMLRRVVSHARRLGIQREVFDEVITTRDRGVRRRVPGAPGERGVRPSGCRLGRRALRRHAAPRHGACSTTRRRTPRTRRSPAMTAFKLHDTFGFPIELLAGDRGGRGALGRYRPVRGPARGAARPCACGREEGRDRSRGRSGSADRVRRVPGPRGGVAGAPPARARTTPSSMRRRRASGFGSSSSARRSTPRAAVRSATRARSGRTPGRSA